VAGCVSIREDFDKYGFIMPVMPRIGGTSWRLRQYTSKVDRIADEPGILERISTEEGDGYLSITLHLQPYVFLRQLALECMRNCAQRS